MNKVWFTSDLHFGHKNIVKFTNRGEETTAEDHDDWLIGLWNNSVHSSDTIYHLGDFSFHKNVETTMYLLRHLKGNIVLLKGNHDYGANFKEYPNHARVTTKEYYEKQFTVGDKKVQICMFHFPIGSWHKQSYGSWHLHGHSHGGYTKGEGKILDVGIDNAFNLYGKHKFFDLEMIEEYMRNREVVIADAHRSNL